MERLMKLGDKETVQTLIGIDGINCRTRYYILGSTALHFACENDNPGVAEAIRLFRDKDVDINAINEDGVTALMIAVSSGCVDIVECLLELGSDVNVVGYEGSVALHLAYKDLSTYFMQPTEKYQKIVDLLLFCGTEAQYFPTFLDKIYFENGDTHLAESVIARVAEIDFRDSTQVSNPVRRNIRNKEKYKDYFSQYKKALGEMKSTTVYGSVSLLDLLNGTSDEKLVHYARNQEFMVAYDQIATEKFDSMPHYYSNVIKRRVAAAVTMAKLEEHAASVICKIMGLNIGHIVANEVVSYLEIYDTESFCEAA